MSVFEFKLIYSFVLSVILIFCTLQKPLNIAAGFSLLFLYYFTVVAMSPGGADVDVYKSFQDNMADIGLYESMDFFDTEYYLYPFMIIGNYFNLDMLLIFAISIFFINSIFVVLLKNANRNDYILSVLLFVVSPFAPYMLTNAIRQGFGIYLLIYVLSLEVRNSLLFKEYIYAIVTHRSMLLIMGLISFQKTKFNVFIFVLITILTVVAIEYVTDYLEIVAVYRKIHSGEGDFLRLILRVLSVAAPYYLALFLYGKNNKNINADFLEYVGLSGLILVVFFMNYKLADRFSYYYCAIYSVKALLLNGRGRYFVLNSYIASTILMIWLGLFDNLWAHDAE